MLALAGLAVTRLTGLGITRLARLAVTRLAGLTGLGVAGLTGLTGLGIAGLGVAGLALAGLGITRLTRLGVAGGHARVRHGGAGVDRLLLLLYDEDVVSHSASGGEEHQDYEDNGDIGRAVACPCGL